MNCKISTGFGSRFENAAYILHCTWGYFYIYSIYFPPYIPNTGQHHFNTKSINIYSLLVNIYWTGVLTTIFFFPQQFQPVTKIRNFVSHCWFVYHNLLCTNYLCIFFNYLLKEILNFIKILHKFILNIIFKWPFWIPYGTE